MDTSGDTGTDLAGAELFLCHDPATDGRFAARLRDRLERFGRPGDGPAALRVAGVGSAGGSASAEPVPERSGWLVLVASAAAAGSERVGRELAWWLEHRSPARILIVPTGGGVVWDDAHRDDRAPALPPALVAVLDQGLGDGPRRVGGAPPGVTPTLDAVVIGIAAAVRGMPVEELFAGQLAAQRRTVRRTVVAGAAVALLLVASLVASLLTLVALDAADRRATAADTRPLLATVAGLLDTHLDVAQLLAVRAFRADPTPRTRAALLGAVTADPELTRFLAAPAPVRALAGSGDGRTVLLGLDDGRVLRWRRDAPAPEPVLTLPEPVRRVAVNGAGTVVVAAGATTVAVAAAGRPPSVVARGSGHDTVSDVAVSPSGRVLGVIGSVDEIGRPAVTTLSLVDVASGRRIDRAHDAGYVAGYRVRLPSDDRAVLVDPDGRTETRRTADGAVVDARTDTHGFDPRSGVGTVSADGRFLAGRTPSGTIETWPTAPVPPPRPPSAALVVRSPVAAPTAMVLSRDASRLAVTDGDGEIHVVPAVVPTGVRPAEVTLRGLTGVGTDGLAFLGDDLLLSASGRTVGVWDLRGGGGRVGRSWRTADLDPCAGCAARASPPRVSISPDGRRLAVGGRATVTVAPLDGPSGAAPRVVRTGSSSGGTPVWLPDGTLAVVTGPPGTGPVDRSVPGLPLVSWALDDPRSIDAAAATPDGRVTLVTGLGVAHVVEGRTGRPVLTRRISPGELDVHAGGGAAVSADGGLVAAASDSVVITDLATGAVVGRVPSPATAVAFAGGRLLVVRPDGSLEVWDGRGGARQRTVAGDADRPAAPVVDASGTVVARLRGDGTTDLVDLTGDVPPGRLPATPGAPPGGTVDAFAPVGRTLVTVADAGPSTVVTVRDLSDDALVADACGSVGRDLTAEEWVGTVGTDVPRDLRCG